MIKYKKTSIKIILGCFLLLQTNTTLPIRPFTVKALTALWGTVVGLYAFSKIDREVTVNIKKNSATSNDNHENKVLKKIITVGSFFSVPCVYFCLMSKTPARRFRLARSILKEVFHCKMPPNPYINPKSIIEKAYHNCDYPLIEAYENLKLCSSNLQKAEEIVSGLLSQKYDPRDQHVFDGEDLESMMKSINEAHRCFPVLFSSIIEDSDFFKEIGLKGLDDMELLLPEHEEILHKKLKASLKQEGDI